MSDERLPKKVFHGELPKGTSKESLPWRTTEGNTLSRWPEETLQRHTQSLSEGFRHTSGVLGTVAQERSKWRGLIKKGAVLYEKLKSCEAESAENAK